MDAYLNAVSTAAPANDVHDGFVQFAGTLLDDRPRALFNRLAERSQIDHRWSVLRPDELQPDALRQDAQTTPFYRRGAFPPTSRRMRVYEERALDLAVQAVDGLKLGDRAKDVTHVIVTSCTGLSAPGIDLQLIAAAGLNSSVERTVIGFMGCYAAINALKLARHIVRSEPAARVLIVSLELCTLHLQETSDLEQVLSFLVFGDGCAAALVSADQTGLALDSFHALLAPQAADQITWNIGDQGFDMVLSGKVPTSLAAALRDGRHQILGPHGTGDIDLWAVHPGGRSILDAVEGALQLPPEAMTASRRVLRAFGNMSSATILFVFADLLRTAQPGQRGCGMAFGPGLTAETVLFRAAA